MRKTLPIAAACAALSLASCEVLFPSTVANDVSDGGLADVGGPVSDSGAPDGADATTSTRDAGDAAATDAAAAVDASLDGPYCIVHPGHTHCFDFDTVGSALTGWDGNNLGAGATVVLDPTAYRSPPDSMKSSVQNGSPNGTYAVLTETLPLGPSQLAIAADIRPGLPSGSVYDGAELLGTHLSGTYGYYGVGVGITQTGPALGILWPTDDAGGYMSKSETFQSFDPDDAGWTHVEMTITFGPPLSVVLTFNGQTEWNGPFSGTVAVVNPTPGDVAVGIVATGDSGPLVVNYDNVTMDVK